jgi:tRNA uridine 5-carbamoylmethylation protein Kti12
MPLIIMTGLPGSGKTRVAEALRQFFSDKEKEAIIVSEGD